MRQNYLLELVEKNNASSEQTEVNKKTAEDLKEYYIGEIQSQSWITRQKKFVRKITNKARKEPNISNTVNQHPLILTGRRVKKKRKNSPSNQTNNQQNCGDLARIQIVHTYILVLWR